MEGHKTHWRASAVALFLPGLIIAAGYGLLYFGLSASGRGGGVLARISLIVLLVGVPLILAHAGLRLSTISLVLKGAHLEAHPGIPAGDPVQVAYRDIRAVSVKRGLSGRLTGAGSLVISTARKKPVVLSGLQDPDSALASVRERVAGSVREAKAAAETV